MLGLLDGVPIALVEVAYRFWVKELHPDVGGDPEQMQEVNVAYAAIKKAVQDAS